MRARPSRERGCAPWASFHRDLNPTKAGGMEERRLDWPLPWPHPHPCVALTGR